jgi:tRNA A-37 threonylcarbamoyl transferase component Bud32
VSDFYHFYTPEEMALLKREGLDTVEGAFAYAGGQELSKPGLGTRRRFRLELTDDSGRPVTWYMKRYGPAGRWRRLLRDFFLPWRRPPGRADVKGVVSLENAGVPTMRVVHGEEEWDGLGFIREYVILTAVPGDALERCLAACLPRWDAQTVASFNAALLDLVRRLHGAGLVHRDLYASHVFLDETPDGPRLYLIDLTRIFRPRWRKFRWRVKDLSQLKYSMPASWVEQYWQAFLDGYLGDELGRRGRWARAIDRKAASMRRRRREGS